MSLEKIGTCNSLQCSTLLARVMANGARNLGQRGHNFFFFFSNEKKTNVNVT